jgi:hypothetical protein
MELISVKPRLERVLHGVKTVVLKYFKRNSGDA